VKHIGVVDYWEKSFWKLVSHKAMKSLVSIRVPNRVIGEGFEDRPTKIRELTVDGEAPIGRIERARAFEHLRVLRCRKAGDRWPRLFLGNLATRLERATFSIRGWDIVLTRGEDGRLSDLAAKAAKVRWSEESDAATLSAAIHSLPEDALTRASVELGKKKPSGISDLKRALQRQKRLAAISGI
jgi:hypothetical protein